jgi:hypothetical protein
MKQKELWTTIVVAAVVGILSSTITVLIINNGPLLSPVNANECTADGTCEVNSLISQGSIGMDNPAWHIFSQGWIGARQFITVGDANLGYPQGGESILTQGDIRSKAAVYGEQFVSANDYLSAGNYLIVGNPNGYPGQGGILANGDIRSKAAVYGEQFVSANDYLSAGGYIIAGNPGRYPGQGGIVVAGNIGSNNLQGTGKAYACITSGGYLYRSTTACSQSAVPAQQQIAK